MGNDLFSETLRSIGTIVMVTLTGAALGLLFGCVLGSCLIPRSDVDFISCESESNGKTSPFGAGAPYES